jgi:putative oxidoreductase
MDRGTLLQGTTPLFLGIALLLGRVAIGLCFVVHALGKLGIVGSAPLAGFAEWLGEIGVAMPQFQARLAMISELVGGLLLSLGLATRPAALVRSITMPVAGLMGRRGAGYPITNDPPGAEYALNLAAVCLMFLLIGPGTISLDATLFQNEHFATS